MSLFVARHGGASGDVHVALPYELDRLLLRLLITTRLVEGVLLTSIAAADPPNLSLWLYDLHGNASNSLRRL
jgi:hypothetical protein